MADFKTYSVGFDLAAALGSLPVAGSWDEVAGSRITSATGEEYYAEVNSETGERRIKRHRPVSVTNPLGIDDLIEDVSTLPADVKDALNIGHASGLTFTGTGFYAGKFHGPEEVLSQASTIRGPGIIARAMEALDGAARGSRPVYSQAGPITINPTVKNDFAGAHFSSEVDIDKMIDRMSRQMESVAIKAVTRAIGQGRT